MVAGLEGKADDSEKGQQQGAVKLRNRPLFGNTTAQLLKQVASLKVLARFRFVGPVV
jgi:hypothetical protein